MIDFTKCPKCSAKPKPYGHQLIDSYITIYSCGSRVTGVNIDSIDESKECLKKQLTQKTKEIHND